MSVGDTIPAERVAEMSSHKPEPGEEAMLVTDNGMFWGVALEDGSFRLDRAI